MSRTNSLKLLGALAFLAFLALPIFPISLHSSFAQEDNSEYDSESSEEEQVYVEDEEYYEEDDEETDQGEAPYDDYYYEDETAQSPVKTSPFDDSVTLSEREIITINVLANDRELLGKDTSPRLVEITEPEFGQVTINSDNTITYAPSQFALPPGYEKTDIVTYTASADGISSYTGTVTLWIQQVNDPPIAFSANYTIKENVQSTFYLGAHDEDDDSLTFTVITDTEYGTSEVDSSSGTFVYTPLFEFSGKELLTFQVNDGSSTSNLGSIIITVEEVGGESSLPSQDDDEEADSESNSTADNSKPVADAGNDFFALTEDRVTLDGSESYAIDDDLLAYSWEQLSGPGVMLEGLTSAYPSFDAPEIDSITELIFELTVTAGNLTDTDLVTVTILPISIDIIPNNFQNEIIIDEDEPEAEIPVAIFGSSVLDVSISVDVESLGLGPDSAPAVQYELLDSNGDDLTDLISYYRTGDLGLDSGDKKACFSGSVTTENGVTVKFYTCQTVKVEVVST